MSLQQQYDNTPYPLYAFKWTHPNHLHTMGKLFGLNTAAPTQCRVLELGCAAGLNLIAMAALLPESTFVGIDLSPVQIEQGRAMIEKLGLKNITLHAADLQTWQDDHTYDYIIAHGLFSWVPEAVRTTILDLYQTKLTPHGVGYISYNTYPGWHLLEGVRDLMRFSTSDIDNPHEAVPQAIDMLEFVGKAAQESENQAYGVFVDVYAQHLQGQVDINTKRNLENIWFDEMGETNQPFYFHQFAALLEKHSLHYLAEANLPTLFPHDFAPSVVQQIDTYAKGDRIRREQYMDFLRNRRFRETLIVRAEAKPTAQPQDATLAEFYFGTRAKPAEDTPADTLPTTFVTQKGRTLAADNAATAAALYALYHAYPQALNWVELCAAVAQVLGFPTLPEDARTSLHNDLFRLAMTSSDLISLHTWRPPHPTDIPAQPYAVPVARLLAEDGDRLVDAWHQMVDGETLVSLLLPAVDGTRTHADLLEIMRGWIDDGIIQLPADADVDAILQRQLQRILTWYLHNALLITAP